jgi:hypothetical protein
LSSSLSREAASPTRCGFRRCFAQTRREQLS